MVIAVDFDGTLFKTDYPTILEPRKDVIEIVKGLRAIGHKIILNTCRVGEILDDAVNACKAEGLEFDAVNENLPERIAEFCGDCRKISADFYIEDRVIAPDELGFILRLADKL